jgi:thiol:disulfide interchange protein DsbD
MMPVLSRFARLLARAAFALTLPLIPMASAQFSSAPPTAEGFSEVPVNAGNATLQLVSANASATPGTTFMAALHLDIAPGWHVYWINAGDSGLPAQIDWVNTAGAEPGEFSWPAPFEQPLDGLMNYGYEGELILPFSIRMPDGASGPVRLEGNASYLICKDICIPEEARLALTVDAGPGAPNPEGEALVARGLARVPPQHEGTARITRAADLWTLSVSGGQAAGFLDGAASARFFPLDHQIEHPPVQPARTGADGFSLTLTPAKGLGGTDGIAGVVVVTLPDGTRRALAISATPGEPLHATADTAFQTAANGQGGGANGGGAGGTPEQLATMSLWAALGFAFLGGMILNLMPCVLPVLSMKALGLASAASRGQASHVRAHGLAYLVGVVASMLAIAAALIALQAAGGTAGIGVQLQYPWLVAIFALVTFLIGLNLYGYFEVGNSLVGVGDGLARKEGLTGAFFTGVLATMLGAPCIGPFLGAASGWALGQPPLVILTFFAVMGLGLAFPFTVISFAPGLRRLLPKPGAWMETLKQVFAFPMFLTSAWLLWVLAMGEGGPNAMAATVMAGVLIVFAIWVVRRAGESARPVGLALAAIAVIAGAGSVFTATRPASASAETALAITPWSRAAVDEALAAGHPVFVDFTAAWCVSCQANKISTLRNPQVVAAFKSTGTVFMEADWTDRNDTIADELKRFGRAGVPLYLYYRAGDNAPVILDQLLRPGYVLDILKGE